MSEEVEKLRNLQENKSSDRAAAYDAGLSVEDFQRSKNQRTAGQILIEAFNALQDAATDLNKPTSVDSMRKKTSHVDQLLEKAARAREGDSDAKSKDGRGN